MNNYYTNTKKKTFRLIVDTGNKKHTSTIQVYTKQEAEKAFCVQAFPTCYKWQIVEVCANSKQSATVYNPNKKKVQYHNDYDYKEVIYKK